MGVRVDEAGRDDHARGVDRPSGLNFGRGRVADEGDAVGGQSYIGRTSGRTGAVDYSAAAQQHIHPLLRCQCQRPKRG